MTKSELPIKNHFSVVSESNGNIAKAVTLSHNILAKIDLLCMQYDTEKNVKMSTAIISYNDYEYITETQYKNILTLIETENKVDMSLPDRAWESDELTDAIQDKAKLVSKTIRIPVILNALLKTKNRKFCDAFGKLHKHYEYMIDVVFTDVLDSGGRMTPLQMKQMNVINKEINKKKLWEM